MKSDTNILVIMETVHQSLKMEDCLEKECIAYSVVAKPRNLGADCGVALKVHRDFVVRIQHLAENMKCSIKGIYEKQGDEWIKVNC